MYTRKTNAHKWKKNIVKYVIIAQAFSFQPYTCITINTVLTWMINIPLRYTMYVLVPTCSQSHTTLYGTSTKCKACELSYRVELILHQNPSKLTSVIYTVFVLLSVSIQLIFTLLRNKLDSKSKTILKKKKKKKG